VPNRFEGCEIHVAGLRLLVSTAGCRKAEGGRRGAACSISGVQVEECARSKAEDFSLWLGAEANVHEHG
jgi:hypothetical protein